MVEVKHEKELCCNNLKKLRVTARRISFLMPHQNVLPDLKELATELCPLDADPEKIDRNSEAYLLGAFEALAALISCLEEKRK
jgi:hypothetical protein